MSEARRIAERLEIHYTPKHGSWLNMAEIEIGVWQTNAYRRIPDQIGSQRNRDAIGWTGASRGRAHQIEVPVYINSDVTRVC